MKIYYCTVQCVCVCVSKSLYLVILFRYHVQQETDDVLWEFQLKCPENEFLQECCMVDGFSECSKMFVFIWCVRPEQ